MTDEQASQIFLLLENHSMKRRNSRKLLARQVAAITGYWSLRETESFVEEMRGLDFSNREDCETFVKFLLVWFPTEGNR